MAPTGSSVKLLLTNINYAPGFLQQYWERVYQKSQIEGQFQIEIAKKFSKNRFVSRTGNWPTLWQMELPAGYEMPKADPNFRKTFAEVTNERAQDIRKRIQESDVRVAVFYSGGIDSVICLSALIQNLSAEELKNIEVCMSSESLLENAHFFDQHIRSKFKILDSAQVSYREIENENKLAISCDQGDSLFGTELATEFYYKNEIQSVDAAYSKYKDQIIQLFQMEGHPQFGEKFFERLEANLQSSPVPIFSVHDFFWWIIFNLKYMDCALRGPIFYYHGPQNRKKAVTETIINWFHSPQYQLWSLANNNNGEKIRGSSAATYKWAGRQYIYDFDKNDWFRRHKLKLSSLIQLSHRNKNDKAIANTFALDQGFNLMSLSDIHVRESVESWFVNA